MLIALLSLPCQRTPRKSSENIAMLCSTTEPLLHVPEALELGTPCYKLVGPNGVHYRGILLCIYHKGFFITYLDRFAWGSTDSVGELSSLEVAQRFLEGKRGLQKWQNEKRDAERIEDGKEEEVDTKLLNWALTFFAWVQTEWQSYHTGLVLHLTSVHHSPMRKLL